MFLFEDVATGRCLKLQCGPVTMHIWASLSSPHNRLTVLEGSCQGKDDGSQREKTWGRCDRISLLVSMEFSKTKKLKLS